MTDESIKLLAFQQQLEKDIEGGVTFVGLSVTQTIHACIVAGLSKKAERLRTDFKVPDKRYGMTCESRFLMHIQVVHIQFLVDQTARPD